MTQVQLITFGDFQQSIFKVFVIVHAESNYYGHEHTLTATVFEKY